MSQSSPASAVSFSNPLTPMEQNALRTTWGRYLSELERAEILRAEARCEKPGRAIDLGCGGGRWSKLLSDRGWEMTSTDIDAPSLAVCAANVPKARCVLVSPSDRTIPAETNSLQLALCMEVPLII